MNQRIERAAFLCALRERAQLNEESDDRHFQDWWVAQCWKRERGSSHPPPSLWTLYASIILRLRSSKGNAGVHKTEIHFQTMEHISCPNRPGSTSESLGSMASSSVNGRRQLCLSPKARLFRLAGKVPSEGKRKGFHILFVTKLTLLVCHKCIH